MTKRPDGLNGDYFVDTQDFDPLWAKNIPISPVQTTATAAMRTCFWRRRRDCRRSSWFTWQGKRHLKGG